MYNKIGYLVYYSYGQWDDYTECNVKVFTSKEQAEAYVDKWNRIYDRWQTYYHKLYKAFEEDEDLLDKWWRRKLSFEYYGIAEVSEIEIVAG